MYVINIDRKDRTRLYLADSEDKRCQPREKKRVDVYWATERDAL